MATILVIVDIVCITIFILAITL